MRSNSGTGQSMSIEVMNSDGSSFGPNVADFDTKAFDVSAFSAGLGENIDPNELEGASSAGFGAKRVLVDGVAGFGPKRLLVAGSADFWGVDSAGFAAKMLDASAFSAGLGENIDPKEFDADSAGFVEADSAGFGAKRLVVAGGVGLDEKRPAAVGGLEATGSSCSAVFGANKLVDPNEFDWADSAVFSAALGAKMLVVAGCSAGFGEKRPIGAGGLDVARSAVSAAFGAKMLVVDGSVGFGDELVGRDSSVGFEANPLLVAGLSVALDPKMLLVAGCSAGFGEKSDPNGFDEAGSAGLVAKPLLVACCSAGFEKMDPNGFAGASSGAFGAKTLVVPDCSAGCDAKTEPNAFDVFDSAGLGAKTLLAAGCSAGF